MVGLDVVMLVVLMQFWFRFVNKVCTAIVPGLTKYYEVKVITKDIPAVVASYNILKRGFKAGAIIMFVPNWIIIPHFFSGESNNSFHSHFFG